MTLPDIETDDISFIAYWNALDNGFDEWYEDELDFMDAEDAFDSYERYVNGLDGMASLDFDAGQPRTIYLRVKADGWVVAWMDTTENYGLDWDDPYNGVHDIMYDWSSSCQHPTEDGHALTEVIKFVYDELENVDHVEGDTIEFDPSDVGLFAYHRPATNMTMWRYDHDERDEITISIPESVDLLSGYVAGYANGSEWTSSSGSWEDHNGESHTIVAQGDGDSRDHHQLALHPSPLMKAGEEHAMTESHWETLRMSGYILWRPE